MDKDQLERQETVQICQKEKQKKYSHTKISQRDKQEKSTGIQK